VSGAVREAGAPLVSVVVPTLAGSSCLADCLLSLERQELRDFETIVVDNSPAAATRDLPPPASAARIVRTGENLGFAGGANAGAAVAAGDFLAFLNDDVRLEPSWLRAMVSCLERHPRAASAAGKVVRASDARILDGAGDAMTRALKAYRRGQGRLDTGRYDHEEQIFSAPGTACLWRARAFRDLGGFDAGFFAYYEDVDLGFRARRAGYECWYTPAAVAVHHGAATATSRIGEFEAYYGVRNRWRTIVKNAPAGWILRELHWIVVGEITSAARSAIVGDLGPLIRAYRDVFRSRRELLAERRSRGGAAVSPDMAPRPSRRLPPLDVSLWRLALRRRSQGDAAVTPPP